MHFPSFFKSFQNIKANYYVTIKQLKIKQLCSNKENYKPVFYAQYFLYITCITAQDC